MHHDKRYYAVNYSVESADTTDVVDQLEVLFMVDSDLYLLSTFGGCIGLHNDGAEIACIERYDAVSLQLGARMDEIRGKAPARAADWLADFLDPVQTLYSFRCLPGPRQGEAWREIDSVANYLWHEHGGIFQTPEGFTNEYGYHILFSSPDTVSGFKMDLGDSGRLECFLRGELPAGVELDRVGLQDPFEFCNPLTS